jgi:hypothetical protein
MVRVFNNCTKTPRLHQHVTHCSLTRIAQALCTISVHCLHRFQIVPRSTTRPLLPGKIYSVRINRGGGWMCIAAWFHGAICTCHLLNLSPAHEQTVQQTDKLVGTTSLPNKLGVQNGYQSELAALTSLQMMWILMKTTQLFPLWNQYLLSYCAITLKAPAPGIPYLKFSLC